MSKVQTMNAAKSSGQISGGGAVDLAAAVAAERARISEILHARELAPYAQRVIAACRLAVGAPELGKDEIISLVETHVSERNEVAERREAQTRRALAELAGVDAAIDLMGVLSIQLRAIPARQNIDADARAKLSAELEACIMLSASLMTEMVENIRSRT